jgi:hypothetical protein
MSSSPVFETASSKGAAVHESSERFFPKAPMSVV